MPGYRKPGKEKAYRAALNVAGNFSDEFLNTSPDALHAVILHIEQAFPKLHVNDVREVSEKAIRVVRERSIGQGPGTIQKIARLNQHEVGLLAELAAEFGSENQIIRLAIRRLHEATF